MQGSFTFIHEIKTTPFQHGNIHFTYQGKPHRGLLAISTEEYPHFYWFYREDPQLAGELGDLAFYTISPDSFGIYQARLVRYEVPDLVTPPEHVLLVRSARRWVGF